MCKHSLFFWPYNVTSTGSRHLRYAIFRNIFNLPDCVSYVNILIYLSNFLSHICILFACIYLGICLYHFIIYLLLLSPFSPHPSPPPQPSPPPTLDPTSLCFVHVSFIHVPDNPSPSVPIIPSHLPSGYCQLFLISMSLVIFCLLVHFVDYVPLIGEIIWYLSLTSWLISLSIMLSSSIQAVMKGRSSFFLSAE